LKFRLFCKEASGNIDQIRLSIKLASNVRNPYDFGPSGEPYGLRVKYSQRTLPVAVANHVLVALAAEIDTVMAQEFVVDLLDAFRFLGRTRFPAVGFLSKM